MLRVSGPTYVAIFHVPTSNKYIYLFGDIHGDKKGLCDGRDRTFVTKFIDNLTKPLDVFLESYWVTSHDKTHVPQHKAADVMTTVFNHYRNAMYATSHRLPALRVHYTDIRTSPNLSYFMNMVNSIILNLTQSRSKHMPNINELVAFFPTGRAIVKFLNVVLLSNDYVNAMESLLGKEGAAPFVNPELLTNVPRKKNRTIHRVRKQILKLTPTDRRMLLLYHRRKCDEILAKTKAYDTHIANIKVTLRFDDHDQVVILETLMAFMTHIMDMYALSRMIHYIRGDGKTLVSYAGVMHTQNYVDFFAKYWQTEATLVHHEDGQKRARQRRCVNIPLTCLNPQRR